MNHLIVLSSQEDFISGQTQCLTADPSIGRGALVLDAGAEEGSFVSQVFSAEAFSTLVLSWNTDVPQGCESEAYCRVQSGGVWSEWLSWGVWSPFVRRASLPRTSGGVASVETDTLTMKDGLQGEAIQLKCVLRRKLGTAGPAPALRLLAATYRQCPQDRLPNTQPPIHIDHAAPAYSQGIRDPNISFRMCSPTTATVLMNAQQRDLLPEETAMACWDYEYNGFGNWAFTMAAAASFGFETYLTYTDGDGLKRELAKGYPVGANVAYSNTPERATDHAPYVENTPGFTNGHLLTIRGLTERDGREMVLVNDSYGNPDSRAMREYPLEQFLHCWHGILYIVRPALKGAGYAAPYRVPAKLVKTDFGDEFRLVTESGELPLAADFNGGRNVCNGVVAYTLEDAYRYPTTANRPFSYTKVTVNGNVFLPAKQLLAHSPMGDAAAIYVYVINDRGVTYTATLTSADL